MSRPCLRRLSILAILPLLSLTDGQWSSATTEWPTKGFVQFEVTSGATTANITIIPLKNSDIPLVSTN